MTLRTALACALALSCATALASDDTVLRRATALAGDALLTTHLARELAAALELVDLSLPRHALTPERLLRGPHCSRRPDDDSAGLQ